MATARTQPRIVLTSGEPAGIGPDLCIALVERELPCEWIVTGDRRVFGARARQLGKSISIRDFDPAKEIERGVLTVAHHATANPVVAGTLDSKNANHVLAMLDFAVDGCINRDFDAMVTAPVQKSVINDAGVPFSGHTEYLAERTQSPLPVMMLVAAGEKNLLRVALATTHLPLTEVSAAITGELIESVVEILARDLAKQFRIATPRILVCGLNPHAGESGHLGREEIEIISPAVDALRKRGIALIGPVPADTAFTPHMLDRCDVVLAMYHDQGLPTLKYAGFGNAVNVTLGLPIIRTSVDHGTALDLAGTGKADVGSLVAAIELAANLASAGSG